MSNATRTANTIIVYASAYVADPFDYPLPQGMSAVLSPLTDTPEEQT